VTLTQNFLKEVEGGKVLCGQSAQSQAITCWNHQLKSKSEYVRENLLSTFVILYGQIVRYSHYVFTGGRRSDFRLGLDHQLCEASGGETEAKLRRLRQRLMQIICAA
jgi:hypothetical protein